MRLAHAVTLTGAAGVALAWTLSARERFWANWVVWVLFLLTVALGALFLVALEHLVGARWSVPLRRVPERLASLLVLAAPLTLVALLSLPSLFHRWAGPEAALDSAVSGKAAWLSVPFFCARAITCLLLWLVSYRILVGGSVRQDATRDPRQNVRARRFAPAFMAILAISVTVVAFDWISSLEPSWYSDILGVYVFAGAFQAGLAATGLGVLRQKDAGRLAGVTGEHLRNVGTLMFGFTVFWAYIAFAQYMLIWYANLPEEVVWYQRRSQGGWLGVVLLLALARFFVPFFALITADAKSDPTRLRWVAWLVLFGHALDLYWLVLPSVGPLELPWPEIAFASLFGGGAVLWLVRALSQGEDMPVGDPFVEEALEQGR